MNMVGYIITRVLTDEEHAELLARLQSLGAEYAPRQGATADAAPAVTADWRTHPANNIDIGGVHLLMVNGIPLHAHLISDPNRNAAVPLEVWRAVVDQFPTDAVLPMVAIAFLESDFRPDAENHSEIEDSIGLYQVNVRAHPAYDPAQLREVEYNVSAARAIYDAEGYGAWWNSARLAGLI